MSGLFSPNIRVSNEPLYLRSKIRTMTRCLSPGLSTLRIFAGIKVIWGRFLRLSSVNLGSIFKDSDGLNLASFYHLLPYFSHEAALASTYSKAKSRFQSPSNL
jgi:hypothetical protein